MIDFKNIKERPGRIYIELLIHAPELFLMLYGLKMLLTWHGHMPLSVRGEVYSYLRFVPVNGTLAAIVGLEYFTFGSFICLSDGRPPPENRQWPLRVGRALVRWGSLVVALLCFVKAEKLASGYSLDLSGLPPGLLVQIVGFIAGLITLFSFLGAMFQREQVKRELDNQGCAPLHIWWRPAAYWLGRYWFTWLFPTGFRVAYTDPSGRVHKGYCFVYRSFVKDWQWGNRRVQWLADTATGPLSSAEVWVGDEILQPKLKKRNGSREPNNLLENPDRPPD